MVHSAVAPESVVMPEPVEELESVQTYLIFQPQRSNPMFPTAHLPSHPGQMMTSTVFYTLSNHTASNSPLVKHPSQDCPKAD